MELGGVPKQRPKKDKDCVQLEIDSSKVRDKEEELENSLTKIDNLRQVFYPTHHHCHH